MSFYWKFTIRQLALSSQFKGFFIAYLPNLIQLSRPNPAGLVTRGPTLWGLSTALKPTCQDDKPRRAQSSWVKLG